MKKLNVAIWKLRCVNPRCKFRDEADREIIFENGKDFVPLADHMGVVREDKTIINPDIGEEEMRRVMYYTSPQFQDYVDKSLFSFKCPRCTWDKDAPLMKVYEERRLIIGERFLSGSTVYSGAALNYQFNKKYAFVNSDSYKKAPPELREEMMRENKKILDARSAFNEKYSIL